MTWRDHIKIHPAADLFPMMSEAELRELGEDIKARGLQTPIMLCQTDDGIVLLDGRNRLDAMELVGLPILDNDNTPLGRHCRLEYQSTLDPLAYVISANIRRRHLTPKKKAELIAAVLKLKPELSDRQIAKQVKVDHHKVAKVRKAAEATGEVAPVEKRVGGDGKARKQPERQGSSPYAEPAPSCPSKPADVLALLLQLWKKAGDGTRLKFLAEIGIAPPAAVAASEPEPPTPPNDTPEQKDAPAPAAAPEQNTSPAPAAAAPSLTIQHGRKKGQFAPVPTTEEIADNGGLSAICKSWPKLEVQKAWNWVADGCPKHAVPSSVTVAFGSLKDTAYLCSSAQRAAFVAWCEARL